MVVDTSSVWAHEQFNLLKLTQHLFDPHHHTLRKGKTEINLRPRGRDAALIQGTPA